MIDKIKNASVLKKIIIIFVILMILSVFFENYDDEYNDSNSLSIISSSENEVLDSEIKSIAKKEKIKVKIEYADTLDIIDRLNSGEKFDAVWSSNSIWLYNLNSKVVSVKNSKSLSINPVIFGIKKSKAEQLGFVNKEIYTKDIVEAIKKGNLSFSMSNPTSTNSGASAYFGILATLAGNPEVLTSEMLDIQSLKDDLKTFFSGVKRTSGSEDFLEELFLKGDYDAVVAYESSIININKKLEKENKETLYAIYPVDGVSISDSVLGYIDQKDDNKKQMFDKLQSYLLSDNGQKLLEKYGRRTWYGGINANAPQDIFNSNWGINTNKYITPVKYPSTSVIEKALNIYQMELRKPVHVVFCLDYSGSMSGEGFEELQNAMDLILQKENAAKYYIQFSKDDKIDIIPFASNVLTKWTTIDGSNTEQLLYNIKKTSPSGSTALYPAAEAALKALKDEDTDKYNVSVVLMTDGEGNVGSFKSLQNAYEKINKDIPIYSIMFGSASSSQLEKMASLTNGKVFDGKKDLVTAFKKVRGYN